MEMMTRKPTIVHMALNHLLCFLLRRNSMLFLVNRPSIPRSKLQWKMKEGSFLKNSKCATCMCTVPVLAETYYGVYSDYAPNARHQTADKITAGGLCKNHHHCRRDPRRAPPPSGVGHV